MEKKSITINTILNITKTGIQMLFPLITFPYITRVLGPEGIGKIQYVQSIISYFVAFATLGISSYGAREAAKLREDVILFSNFIRNILIINLISTIVSYSILFILIFNVPSFASNLLLFIIFSTQIFFNIIGVEWVYIALEDYFYITIRYIVFQIISLICIFIFVKNSENVFAYATILMVTTCGANICNFLHLRKFVDIHNKFTVDIKKHIKPVSIMFGMTLTASIFTAMDITMLGILTNSEEVGFYSTGIKCIVVLNSFIGVVSATLLPRVSYLYEKNKKQFFEYLNKGIECTLFLAIPTSFMLYVNSTLIIQFLGGTSFEKAIPCLEIMSPVIIFATFSLSIDNQLFLPIRKEFLNLIGLVIGAVTDFVINLLLIPKYGAYGACVGTFFCQLVMMIYHILLFKYFVKENINHIILIVYLIFSFVYLLLACYLKSCIENTFTSFSLSLVCICVYAMFFLFNKNSFFFYKKLLSKVKK